MPIGEYWADIVVYKNNPEDSEEEIIANAYSIHFEVLAPGTLEALEGTGKPQETTPKQKFPLIEFIIIVLIIIIFIVIILVDRLNRIKRFFSSFGKIKKTGRKAKRNKKEEAEEEF